MVKTVMEIPFTGNVPNPFLQTIWCTTAKENKQENYYYSLLLLFVPFRNEADLIKEGETAESAFEQHLEQNDDLNTHSEKLQRMLIVRERVQEPGPEEDDDGPQVAGEATSAMNNVVDLHQNSDSEGPSLEELVQSLNPEKKESHCTDLQPLHMFVSGVGGTGKSFLIKTVRALVSKLWGEETRSTLCAVTAPTGLAAFNVGGVTIHRLLQLPIEHEGRGAGYWKLAKETLKIMRTSLSKLKLLIIDEVFMVSSLNLAYIHLRLDEIFA